MIGQMLTGGGRDVQMAVKFDSREISFKFYVSSRVLRVSPRSGQPSDLGCRQDAVITTVNSRKVDS